MFFTTSSYREKKSKEDIQILMSTVSELKDTIDILYSRENQIIKEIERKYNTLDIQIDNTNKRIDSCEKDKKLINDLKTQLNSALTTTKKKRKVTVCAFGKVVEIEKV